MNLKNADLNLLVALDTLLAERNVHQGGRTVVARAARDQRGATRLRHMFNDPLLVRRGRVMELTPSPRRWSLRYARSSRVSTGCCRSDRSSIQSATSAPSA